MPFEPQGELPSPEDRAPFPETWDEFVGVVKRWLEHHWGDAGCPHCNNPTWRINEVVNLISATEWPIADDSSYGYYPAISVICTKCGHIALVNAAYIFRPPG